MLEAFYDAFFGALLVSYVYIQVDDYLTYKVNSFFDWN
jgi:hypothetical protein